MIVTMLYFDTISKLIKEHGFTWDDVEAIQDNDNRVRYGENDEHCCSLRHMFYCTHVSDYDETSGNSEKLVKAFLEALQEVKKEAI